MGLFKDYQKSMRFASLEQFDNMMRVIQNTVGTNVEEMEEMKSTIMGLAETYPVLADMAARMSGLSGEQVENYREMLNIARYTGDIGRKEYINLLGMVNANKFLTESEKKRLEYSKEYLKDIGTVKRFFEDIKKGFGDIGRAVVTGLIPTSKEEAARGGKGIWEDIALESRRVIKPIKPSRFPMVPGPSYVPTQYMTIKPGEAGYWKGREGEKEEYERAKIARLAERTKVYDQDDLMFRKLIVAEIDKTVSAQKSFNQATIEGMAITGQIDYDKINQNIEETVSLINSQVESKRALLKLLQENKTVQIDEIINNNTILEIDKEIYENMLKRGISQVSSAKNATLQRDLEKDIVAAEKEKLQVSLRVLEARRYTKQVAQSEAALAGKLVQLADNYAIGISASMELRLKEYNFLTKVIQEHEMDLIQIRNRISLEGDNLALRAEELELEKKIADITIQQASAVKSMRSGWVEAIAALNTGAGIFTEIIMSAEKGTGMAARLKGIIPTPFSGRYGAGYGYTASERFSPYQQFVIGGRKREERWRSPYPMYGEEGVIKELERYQRGGVFRKVREQAEKSMGGGSIGRGLYLGHPGPRGAYFEPYKPLSQADITNAYNKGQREGFNLGNKAVIEGLRSAYA